MGFAELLRRGLAAGAAAGLAAAIVMYALVEPAIRRALVIEDARAAEGGHHASDEEPLVERTLQVVGGLGTAVVVGCLFGIVFAVVFARCRHRLPAASDQGRAVVLAALGFLVFSLVPALKIPSNPPAVGDPDTVTRRTLIYVLAILLSVAIVLAVLALDRVVVARGLAPARLAIAVLTLAVAMVVMFVVVPDSPDTIPSDVPADLIWDFRVASLAQLGAMWATMGLVFGWLVTRTSEADSHAGLVAA